MKRTFCILGLIAAFIPAKAQFDGAVGTEGCRAIAISDERIEAWAFGVQVKKGTTQPNGETKVSYGKSCWAQGVPDSTTTSAVSLGYGGEALITFDRPIRDGEGYDFAVFENGFSSTFLELAFVEVSSDGENFFRFPSTSLSTGVYDVQAEHYNNLAGKYEVGYGTPFDLSDLQDDERLDKNAVRFVRLIDVNEGIDTDAEGNVIFDSPGAGSYSAGFDLTAAAVLNAGEQWLISSCESMLANSDTHELISPSNATVDENGNYYKEYTDGNVVYEALGLYGGSFAIGFSPSNHTTEAGYYSSVSLRGLEAEGAGYMVAYYSDYAGTEQHNIVRMQDNSLFTPRGIYLSPSTAMYEHLIGSTFPQEGYLSVTARGFDSEGVQSGSSTVYFVDLRDTETACEAVEDWIFMDLQPLGECNQIIFSLETNDDSGYGMNPPAYFCTDGLTYSHQASNPPEQSLNSVSEIAFSIYPNPSNGEFNIRMNEGEAVVRIFDLLSREVYSCQTDGSTTLSPDLKSGTYILSVEKNGAKSSKKLIIR